MKTPIRLLLAVLAIAVFSVPVFAVQLSLSNAGFETWTAGPGGPPDGWTEDVVDSISVTREAATIHGGSYSGNITWITPTQASCDFISNDVYTVTAGDACSLSVYVYDNDVAGRITIYFIFNTGNSFPSSYYSVDQASWQLMQYKVNAPTGATSMQVAIRAYDVSTSWDGNATVYIDDAEVWGPAQPTENVPPSVGPIYFYPYPTVYPTDDVNVRATITDNDGTVDFDTLWLQTTALAYSYVVRDSIVGNYYWYNIGTNAIGTLVEFYVVAVDDDDAVAYSDTSSYTVADPTPSVQSIAEAQFNNSNPGGTGSCYPAADSGNTVTLTGVVSATLNNRTRYYLQDADSVWSAIYVYGSPDSASVGDTIVATGLVTEYFAVTEFLNPVISYHTTGGTVHAPIVITSDDVSPVCDATSESYESMLVQLNNVLCVYAPAPANGGWVKSDGATDSCWIDDYLYASMPDFIVGQRYNIVGIVSYYSSNFMVYPRNAADIELIVPDEPVIANVQQYPAGSLVDPTDNVMVSAEITDEDGTITDDNLYVETVVLEFLPVERDSIAADGITYWYTIGTNAEGTVVNYYISATDNDANTTTTETYTYTVTEYTPTCADDISDIQTTVVPGAWPECYPSPLVNTAVDLCGIITGAKLDATGSCPESKFFIQAEGGGTWEGVYVYDNENPPATPLNNGDEVEVFGTVLEYNGLTEIAAITDIFVISSGNPAPAPQNVKLRDFESDCSFATEAYEGVLVKLKAVEVLSASGSSWWIKDSTSADSVMMTNYLYYAYTDCAPNPAIAQGAVYDSVFGAMYWYGSSSNPAAGYWRIYPRCGSDLWVSVIPPPVISAVFPVDRDTLCLLFNHDIDGTSLAGASYTLSGGLTYSNPRLDAGNPMKVLLTVAMSPANDGKLDSITVAGVEDADNVEMEPQTVRFRQGFTPISQIQFSSAAGDSLWWPSDMFPEVVTVRAFVTADSTAYHRTNYFISDNNSDENGVCLYIYDGITHPWVPALGDTLVVTGRVDEYYGETEVNTDYGWLYDNMYLVSAAGADPEPLHMGTNSAEYIFRNSGNPVTEALEGVFSKLCDSLVVLTEANGASPYEHYIKSMTTGDTLCLEGQGTMRNFTPPTIGTRIDGMTGVLRWRRGFWRLTPRSDADFNTGYDCAAEPTGACCVAEVCVATNTAAECAALTGIWYVGETCPAYDCAGPACFEYLPGDVNMYSGNWPPAAIGGDVTYLVGRFRGVPTSMPCNFTGDLPTPFWASADANGDCNVIGSDVTKLVSVFRGIGSIQYCGDQTGDTGHFEPCWHTPVELPPSEPAGWPNCE